MTLEFAEALRDQKQAIFEAFQRLIPELARAFPQLAIVVRPHPTEGQEVYQRIAAGNGRIHVTNEGNVVPWLLAARALIHNGCTTGVEAFVMRIPAFTYRPVDLPGDRRQLLRPAARAEPPVRLSRGAARGCRAVLDGSSAPPPATRARRSSTAT